MTTRAQRIRRRNEKRERAYFRMQKLVGLLFIMIGVLLVVTEKDITWLVCVGVPFGGFCLFTKHKLFEDYQKYESEE